MKFHQVRFSEKTPGPGIEPGYPFGNVGSGHADHHCPIRAIILKEAYFIFLTKQCAGICGMKFNYYFK